jgi:hypothetical protein
LGGRPVSLARLTPWYRIKFQTRLEQAADMVEWLTQSLWGLGKTVWIVADGAYARKPFLRPALKTGVVIVSRLRFDAALWTVPTVLPPGRRGRGAPRKYGKDRISLAKRAGHRRGWQTGTYALYGELVQTTYKTFLATYEPVGRAIRVVLVKEDSNWVAYFCTKVDATVQEILEVVADRSAIEQNFHDIKEVHGAGQQQLRNYWANIAAFHVTLWWHTMIELWAWHKSHQQLSDRSASPWDDTSRRPSHADRRNALRRQCLHNEFSRHEAAVRMPRKFRSLWQRLTKLVA